MIATIIFGIAMAIIGGRIGCWWTEREMEKHYRNVSEIKDLYRGESV